MVGLATPLVVGLATLVVGQATLVVGLGVTLAVGLEEPCGGLQVTLWSAWRQPLRWTMLG